ncbi:MAG TPA: DUF4864 domain-containing protein [Candidatus Methylomirabilis sp.]|nr:DUF4864 domain-containing protein [Candidatus Methylomirabilis sp.]
MRPPGCSAAIAVRLAILAVALAAVPALGAPAVAQTERETAAAAEPIMRQLEAFRADDYEAAYAFASSKIRRMFDRPAFEHMVKSGYPEIARSTFAVVAGSEAAPDGHMLIRIRIRGANGNSVEALYDMVREPAGWRINGVVTRPDPGLV